MFEKCWVFLFPSFVLFCRFLWTFQFSRIFYDGSCFFSIFWFIIVCRKLALGPSKLIHLRMRDFSPLSSQAFATASCHLIPWPDPYTKIPINNECCLKRTSKGLFWARCRFETFRIWAGVCLSQSVCIILKSSLRQPSLCSWWPFAPRV